MNHVFVDPVKSLKNVVGLYKNIINKDNIIKPTPANKIFFLFLLKN